MCKSLVTLQRKKLNNHIWWRLLSFSVGTISKGLPLALWLKMIWKWITWLVLFGRYISIFNITFPFQVSHPESYTYSELQLRYKSHYCMVGFRQPTVTYLTLNYMLWESYYRLQKTVNGMSEYCACAMSKVLKVCKVLWCTGPCLHPC